MSVISKAERFTAFDKRRNDHNEGNIPNRFLLNTYSKAEENLSY